MPARKPARKKVRASRSLPCPVCKRPSDNAGELCSACIGLPVSDPAAAKRLALRVRDRLHGGESRGGFVCPYCRFELTWENIGSSETEVTIYVREKIYFCPKCRALLGASSWHTEG